MESAATPPAAGRRTGAKAQALVNGGGPAPEDSQHLVTGIAELDRVLGGGIMPGSLVLIGGDPGIGKSTLLLQFMTGVAAAYGQILYVTSEESLSQIRMRAGRLELAEQIGRAHV